VRPSEIADHTLAEQRVGKQLPGVASTEPIMASARASTGSSRAPAHSARVSAQVGSVGSYGIPATSASAARIVVPAG